MIKTKITDKELLEHIASLPEEGRDVFLLSDGMVRLTAVSATETVNQMRANHKTGLLESYVLGQAYIAGLLLTSMVKGNDRILLQIECGGPIKGISVEAWACGAVRGYLLENPIKLDRPLTTLDTSMLYGPGFLTISRILEGAKEPVSGTVMLQSGNLANDLAAFFQESEQTPTLFYISLDFDSKGRIMGAGGLFIQAMPGCDEEVLSRLQDTCGHLPGLAKAISGGMNISDYVVNAFKDYSPRLLETGHIGFSCPCSREHFEGYLSRLPQAEKEEILKGTFPLELECFNCGSVYGFTKSETEALFTKEIK